MPMSNMMGVPYTQMTDDDGREIEKRGGMQPKQRSVGLRKETLINLPLADDRRTRDQPPHPRESWADVIDSPKALIDGNLLERVDSGKKGGLMMDFFPGGHLSPESPAIGGIGKMAVGGMGMDDRRLRKVLEKQPDSHPERPMIGFDIQHMDNKGGKGKGGGDIRYVGPKGKGFGKNGEYFGYSAPMTPLKGHIQLNEFNSKDKGSTLSPHGKSDMGKGSRNSGKGPMDEAFGHGFSKSQGKKSDFGARHFGTKSETFPRNSKRNDRELDDWFSQRMASTDQLQQCVVVEDNAPRDEGKKSNL